MIVLTDTPIQWKANDRGKTITAVIVTRPGRGVAVSVVFTRRAAVASMGGLAKVVSETIGAAAAEVSTPKPVAQRKVVRRGR